MNRVSSIFSQLLQFFIRLEFEALTREHSGERCSGERLVNRVERTGEEGGLLAGALQVLDFADGRVRLVGVRVVGGGLLVGPDFIAERMKKLVREYRGLK